MHINWRDAEPQTMPKQAIRQYDTATPMAKINTVCTLVGLGRVGSDAWLSKIKVNGLQVQTQKQIEYWRDAEPQNAKTTYSSVWHGFTNDHNKNEYAFVGLGHNTIFTLLGWVGRLLFRMH